MLPRILCPHVTAVREPLNHTRYRGIQTTSTILLTLTAIHTREMSAASKDVRHIVHIFGRISRSYTAHSTATGCRCVCGLGPNCLYHLIQPPLSVCQPLSHTAHPEQLAMRMKDHLDLEHYIDSFVSARRVPPTWFAQRSGGGPC
jgi:hypothetical protein